MAKIFLPIKVLVVKSAPVTNSEYTNSDSEAHFDSSRS